MTAESGAGTFAGIYLKAWIAIDPVVHSSSRSFSRPFYVSGFGVSLSWCTTLKTPVNALDVHLMKERSDVPDQRARKTSKRFEGTRAAGPRWLDSNPLWDWPLFWQTS